MSGAALAAYPWDRETDARHAPAASAPERRHDAVAKRAWHGLVQVLVGPDPPPAWRWQSPQERRAAYAALALATLALCVANLAGIASWAQLLLAVPVVAPLPLAARYPMLAWRIGWLALLLAPLVPAAWWGGWPWGPGQMLALLGAFCLAGIRQRRPALWWMWALTLIPWWLWLAADVPNLNGPAGATVIFTAVAIAVDSIGSRLRAQRALAAQTEARRGRAGAAGRAGGAHPDRAGTARRGRPSHVADRGPGRDRAVPPHRPARAGPGRVRLAERGGARGAGGDAAAARRAAPRPARRSCAAAAAGGPARARRGRPAGRGAGRAVRSRRAGPGAVRRRACARTGSCRNRCPTPASTPPEPRSRVSVGHDSGAVLLRVANGPGGPGPARPRNDATRPGHGLTGMRERVALLGGSLSAGPSPDGGFVVSAVLPLGDTP